MQGGNGTNPSSARRVSRSQGEPMNAKRDEKTCSSCGAVVIDTDQELGHSSFSLQVQIQAGAPYQSPHQHLWPSAGMTEFAPAVVCPIWETEVDKRTRPVLQARALSAPSSDGESV